MYITPMSFYLSYQMLEDTDVSLRIRSNVQIHILGLFVIELNAIPRIRYEFVIYRTMEQLTIDTYARIRYRLPTR